ncbi:MAG: NAD+ synthase [Planctomycetes bacterium]|nr:NAD+ synthase [Planctomycetota bacterium]
MRIGLAQINTTVGDFQGNLYKMIESWQQAREQGVELLVFPELAICGYPPEDLLHKPHFLQANRTALQALASACPDIVLVVGFADGQEHKAYNAAAILREGEIDQIYRKGRLPNFSVFDESRYFVTGLEPVVIEVGSIRVVPTICYDLWNVSWLEKWLERVGSFDLLLNISASPFDMGKIRKREAVIRRYGEEFATPLAYCNLVGGQDELVFDGRSMLADASGRVVLRAAPFEEDLLIADIVVPAKGPASLTPISHPAKRCEDQLDEVYSALLLGTRDYVRKNGFSNILVGLSGGIDSALTAAIAVAALGPDQVVGITMPSKFNSSETLADASLLAENLGITLQTLPIGAVLDHFNETLARVPGWDAGGIAYENLQARIRGTLLMSLSNQLGAMVLTTGNKSETSVGYSTLYGDSAGGFAVIKDVPKTLVYRLARYVNERAGKAVIPETTITRAPSAELRPDQKDSDSLPDYEVLDEIIRGYVERDESAAQLVESGLPEEEVNRVIRLIDRNEYKRRQSPPGVRITNKAFGKDRRLPITNRYDATYTKSS